MAIKDAKRTADQMRATASIIEVLAPFSRADQQHIVAGVFLLMELHKDSPAERAIEQVLQRMRGEL